MTDATIAVLRTIARMARDPNAEARGDIAIVADEHADRLQAAFDYRPHLVAQEKPDECIKCGAKSIGLQVSYDGVEYMFPDDREKIRRARAAAK